MPSCWVGAEGSTDHPVKLIVPTPPVTESTTPTTGGNGAAVVQPRLMVAPLVPVAQRQTVPAEPSGRSKLNPWLGPADAPAAEGWFAVTEYQLLPICNAAFAVLVGASGRAAHPVMVTLPIPGVVVVMAPMGGGGAVTVTVLHPSRTGLVGPDDQMQAFQVPGGTFAVPVKPWLGPAPGTLVGAVLFAVPVANGSQLV